MCCFVVLLILATSLAADDAPVLQLNAAHNTADGFDATARTWSRRVCRQS